jgi:hypothetical protein
MDAYLTDTHLTPIGTAHNTTYHAIVYAYLNIGASAIIRHYQSIRSTTRSVM